MIYYVIPYVWERQIGFPRRVAPQEPGAAGTPHWGLGLFQVNSGTHCLHPQAVESRVDVKCLHDVWDTIPMMTWQNVARVKVNCEMHTTLWGLPKRGQITWLGMWVYRQEYSTEYSDS